MRIRQAYWERVDAKSAFDGCLRCGGVWRQRAHRDWMRVGINRSWMTGEAKSLPEPRTERHWRQQVRPHGQRLYPWSRAIPCGFVWVVSGVGAEVREGRCRRRWSCGGGGGGGAGAEFLVKVFKVFSWTGFKQRFVNQIFRLFDVQDVRVDGASDPVHRQNALTSYVRRRRVPTAQTVQKTVEIPQMLFFGLVLDMPVDKCRGRDSAENCASSAVRAHRHACRRFRDHAATSSSISRGQWKVPQIRSSTSL